MHLDPPFQVGEEMVEILAAVAGKPFGEGAGVGGRGRGEARAAGCKAKQLAQHAWGFMQPWQQLVRSSLTPFHTPLFHPDVEPLCRRATLDVIGRTGGSV